MDEMLEMKNTGVFRNFQQRVVKISKNPFAYPLTGITMRRRIAAFVVKVCKIAGIKIKNFVIGFWQNLETIIVITLSAIGLTALLSQLPFIWTLPLWIEATMVIPVISVIIISILLRIGEWRTVRRTLKQMSEQADRMKTMMMGASLLHGDV